MKISFRQKVLAVFAAMIFLAPNVQAAIFPYIKTAGPSGDLSTKADLEWASKHWDMSGADLRVRCSDPSLCSVPVSPGFIGYSYVGLTFFDIASRNKNWQAWLKYAGDNDLDPDIGMIHYKKNVDVNIAASDYRPREDRFKKIYIPSGEVSRKAYGDENPGDITFPATSGQAVYFGFETRFKEINFNLGSGASAGWQAKWQYFNGVSWVDLTPSSDTTNNLQQSGKVEFMPPPTISLWKRISEQGLGLGTDDLPLYWMRLLVTNSGTAPVVHSTFYYPPTALGQKGIWAQDYLTGPDTGNGTILVPGWDSANDTNGDGVWDANINPNATATFKYQSRAPIYAWYTPQWVTNPGNATLQTWLTQWNKTNLADASGCDALFNDVQTPYIPDRYGMVHKDDPVYIEYPTAREHGQWETDLVNLTQLQEAVLESGDFTIGNIPSWSGSTWSESLMNAHKGAFFEFYISLKNTNSTYGSDWWLNNYGTGFTKRWAVDEGKIIRLMWPRDSGIDFERDSTFGLAVYLQMKQDSTYYDAGDPMGPPPDRYWSKSIEWVGGKDVDTGASYPGVGNPLGDTYQWATGADPAAPTRTYYVFARDYQNVLVLVKPKPRYDSNIDTPSATTHDLGGSYRRLNVDGSLGSIITQITLRNGEAAILVKEISPPPPNNPPVLASIGSKSVNEGSALSFTVSATDADGDTLTYSATPLPAGATFTNQTFSWTPTYEQAGSYNVTFSVADGKGGQDSETITITVNDVATPPPPPPPPPPPTPPTPTPPPTPAPTPPEEKPLLGDFNGDGKVNIYDLSILLSNWKKAKAQYDLNENGLVDIFDLSILLSNWTG